MADKKPAGPPEAITNAAAGCADPASDETRPITSLKQSADAAPRRPTTPRRRRAAPRAYRKCGNVAARASAADGAPRVLKAPQRRRARRQRRRIDREGAREGLRFE